MIPFSEYEEVFQSISPASDGQYKAQVYLREDGTELYIANAGRFNAEAYFGWDGLDRLIDVAKLGTIPKFAHSQIQTLIGAIGAAKGWDVWIPPSDRHNLDWSITERFGCSESLPYGFERVERILQEIDVLWFRGATNELRALFEIEHTTPIYSGLLRFNDIHLAAPTDRPIFAVVANNARRALFVRQLNRPTFRMSKLNELCSFLEYSDVYSWHNRVKFS